MVYGQLILENGRLLDIDDKLVDQIFEVMIRDFSRFALQLYTKGSTTFNRQKICKRMVKRPAVDRERVAYVCDTYVAPLKDSYEMKP